MMKKIVIFLIIVLFNSCSTSNKLLTETSLCNSDNEKYFSIRLVKIDNELQKIISNAKNNFTKKIKVKPEFIIIKLYKSKSSPIIDIDVKDYLYNTNSEREIFANKFDFGCVLNDVLVLIESNNNYEYFKNYIQITNEKRCVKIVYSKHTDVYYHSYELKDEQFILKDSQCTCDMYVR